MKILKDHFYWVDLSPTRGEEVGGIRLVKVLDVRPALAKVVPIILYKNIRCFDEFQIQALSFKRFKEEETYPQNCKYKLISKDITEITEKDLTND